MLPLSKTKFLLLISFCVCAFVVFVMPNESNKNLAEAGQNLNTQANSIFVPFMVRDAIVNSTEPVTPVNPYPGPGETATPVSPYPGPGETATPTAEPSEPTPTPSGPSGYPSPTPTLQPEYGKIVIVQDTTPNDGQDFIFFLTGVTQSQTFSNYSVLDDDSDPVHGNVYTLEDAPVGQYTISQNSVPGYTSFIQGCYGEIPNNEGGIDRYSISGFDLGVHFGLSADETVTCLYMSAPTSEPASCSNRNSIVEQLEANISLGFSQQGYPSSIMGQSFTAPADATELDGITLYVPETTNPINSPLIVALYSGTDASQEPIATGTYSNDVSPTGDPITTGSITSLPVSVEFESPVGLTPGAEYFFSIRESNISLSSSDSSPYAGGQVIDETSLFSNEFFQFDDLMFAVYDCVEEPLTCPAPSVAVDSEDDLNFAIDCFNNSPAGEYEINITADITLVTNTVPIENQNGASLTINGNNHIVDGDSKGRIFNIQEGTVQLNQLTLQNGVADSIFCSTELDFADTCGGAIFISESAQVRLFESVVRTSSAWYGGGIFSDGDLIIEASTVENNTATVGAGVSISGNLLITNSSVISSNYASSGGGGVKVFEGDLDIENSLISNNTGDNGGGGIDTLNATVMITESNIIDNVSEASGGGAAFNISSVTITDSSIRGNLSGNNGGGIDSVASFTRIYNSEVLSNLAVNSGGGIYSLHDTVLITDSTLSNNSTNSNHGGGLYHSGLYMEVLRSTVNDNSSGFGVVHGGGIFLYEGDALIENSTISFNSSGYDGGGFYNYFGEASVVHSTIYGNSALFGGGIYNRMGTIDLSNSLIVENTVNSDSVFADCFNSNQLTISGANFDSDGSCGQAITKTSAEINLDPLLQDNGGPTLTHALLSGSDAIDAATPNAEIMVDQRGVARPQGTAPDLGAFESPDSICDLFPLDVDDEVDLNRAIGCYNLLSSGDYEIDITADITLLTNTLPIDNSNGASLSINGNNFVIDGNNIARVLNIQSSEVDISNLTIQRGNGYGSACEGDNIYCAGGIFVNSAATITLTQSYVLSSTAQYGGGIFNKGQVTILGSVLRANTGSFAGGIYNDGTLHIENSSILGSVSGTNGAGIRNELNGVLTIQNSLFSENSADNDGGAIYNEGSATVNRGRYLDNIAATGSGGGIFNNGQLIVSESEFSNNSARNGGGGILTADFTELTIDQSTIADNSANLGGGVAVSGFASDVTISNSTISTNTAEVDAGGLGNAFGSVKIINTTISGNSAGEDGGGILTLATSTTELFNSTVTNNTAENGGGIYNDFSGDTKLFNSIVAGNPIGNDCFNDPGDDLFVSDGQSLSSDSSCPGTTVSAEINLGPLQDNGGPTLTHALGAGSVAIDAAVADPNVTTDQRGIARPQGGAPDVGAFELSADNEAEITIVVDTTPFNSRVDFRFGGDLGSFKLDNAGGDDGDEFTNSQTFSVEPGSYTIREIKYARWELLEISCSSNNVEVDLESWEMTLSVTAGDSVTCTFLNERAAFINARKVNDLNGSGNYQNGEPFMAGWEIEVYDIDNQLVATDITDAEGRVSIKVKAGDYTVCEVQQDGWTAVRPTQINATFGQPCYSVSLLPKRIGWMRFFNTQLAVRSSLSVDGDEVRYTWDNGPENETVNIDPFSHNPFEPTVIYLPIIGRK